VGWSIWWCERIVSVRVRSETRSTRGRFKQPTGRDYLAYYGLGAVGVLLLGTLASLLDWSRYAFLISAVAWGAVYVPVSVVVLHTRREHPGATR
jgi:hypothetical protein